MEFLFLGFSLLSDGYILYKMLELNENTDEKAKKYPQSGQNYAEYKRKFSKKRKKAQ